MHGRNLNDKGKRVAYGALPVPPRPEAAPTIPASTPAAGTVSEQKLAELKRTSVLYEIGREQYNPYSTAEGSAGGITKARATSTVTLKRSRTADASLAALDVAGIDGQGFATTKMGYNITYLQKGRDDGVERFEDCVESESAPEGWERREPTIPAAGGRIGVEVVVSELCTVHRVSAQATGTPLPVTEGKVALGCGEVAGAQELLSASALQSSVAFGKPVAPSYDGVEGIAEKGIAGGSLCGIEGGNEHTVVPASRGLLIEFLWVSPRSRGWDRIKGGLHDNRRACYFSASSHRKR